MTTLEIIELVAVIVVGLGLGIYYLIKAIKNNWLGKIYKSLKDAVKAAEASGKSGSDKKEYVLKEVENVCREEGIPFQIIKKLVSKTIEKLVEGYNTIAK